MRSEMRRPLSNRPWWTLYVVSGFIGLGGAIAAVACGGDDASDTPGGDAGPAADTGSPSPSDAGSPAHDGGGGFHVPFDWIGIVGTGQSLSVGVQGTPIIDRTQPYHNLKLLDQGPAPQYPLDGGGQLSLVPLVEPIRPRLTGYSDSQYPNNIAGETPHTSMSSQLTALAAAAGAPDYVTLHSVVGWSGHCLADIDREGEPDGSVGRAYPGSLSEARAFERMAAAQGKSFGYAAIVLTHGECDAHNSKYEDGLFQLWQDYNRDLKAITRQGSDIPLVLSQQSTAAPSKVAGAASLVGSALEQWRAGVDHPGQIVCAGPKYQYEYASDNLHLTAAGYRRLGEKYAEVVDAVVNRGGAWHPLQPASVSRAGSTITVHFEVTHPPLAWEESLAAPHQTTNTAWAKGRGFEVVGASGPVTITDAVIRGDAVELTLSAPPAAGMRVRYATVQDGTGNQGGQVDGLRGQLRDSDPFVGRDMESITCTVTHGSASITCPSGSLAARSAHDLVSGSGLAAGTVITATDAKAAATLSSPWTGTTGSAALSFAYDQRNYAVHFDLAVP